MGFPRVSETFIASEIHRVEQAGIRVRLFVIKPVEEREAGLRHPVVERIRRDAGVPARHDGADRAAAPLAPAAPRAVRARAAPHAAPPPARAGPRARDRPRPGAARPPDAALRPAQDLPQGAAAGGRAGRPAARRARGPPPARALRARDDDGDDARLADRRRAVLLHRPRARHLRAPAQPEGLAATASCAPRASPSRAPRRTSATCAAIEPAARVHLVYHGLNADFARLLDAAEPRRSANGTLRVLGVGRLVAKKGFDTLVDACARPAARGVPFEAAIVGQDDKHGDEIRRRIAARGWTAGAAAGPDRPGRAAGRVPPRERAVHALPAAAERPRRDPERARRGDGGRRAGRSPPASPGIPELVEHERQRAARRARRPRGAGRGAASACTRTASWPRGWRARRAQTVRERFDGARHAQQLARPVRGGARP